VYKLAEVLFTEAAKEKERRGNEYAKKPMKREIGNSDLTGGFSGGYTGDFTGDFTGDLSEDLTGDLMGGLDFAAMSDKPPTPIPGLLTSNTDDSVLHNELFEIIENIKGLDGEGMGISEAVRSVARVDSTTSSTSSPSR
jgi:hypothetical protein